MALALRDCWEHTHTLRMKHTGIGIAVRRDAEITGQSLGNPAEAILAKGKHDMSSDSLSRGQRQDVKLAVELMSAARSRADDLATQLQRTFLEDGLVGIIAHLTTLLKQGEEGDQTVAAWLLGEAAARSKKYCGGGVADEVANAVPTLIEQLKNASDVVRRATTVASAVSAQTQRTKLLPL